MAESSTQDVVKQAQSMGDQSSIDVSGSHISTSAGVGKEGPGGGREVLQNASDSGHPVMDGERVTLPSDITTSEYANVNGIDSASYNGSEDNGYQRSTDGESQKNEGQGLDASNWRQRSNSTTKRATSFKPVSVTKNYLAKSTSNSPAFGKSATDRGQPGIQPSSGSGSGPRPRLVAKLGKDKLTTSVAPPSSGGPDASKVWNRNRPAAHAPQKQFTDEELKQQYGIHMATRLQADEATKDGKWADIDDDEDDWAPETVQWMDGTKSTLLPEKIPPPPAKAQAPPPPPENDEETEKKPPTPAQSPPTIQSTGKTILRPGARNNVQMRPGLALKSVPEAPSAPVKSTPSHSSSKSPWASLPPVDKASPVTFNPPQPPSVQVALRRDSSAIDDLPTPSPAREMAADDFDRSWRTDEKGGHTLYNSQSGKYEPVRGIRRGSRHDSNFRPPSVLQRPSQGQADMFHNPEAQPWARRRDSSFDTRPLPDQQDPSKPPQPHAPAISPVDAQHQQASSPEATQQPQPPSDDDVRAEQQRLMRERIELNRRRKQEEQEREEAERRERIRLKLAALAPPVEKENAKTAQPQESKPTTSPQPPAAPETQSTDNTTTFDSQPAIEQQPPIDRQPPQVSPQKPFANTSSPSHYDPSRLSPPKPSSFDQQPFRKLPNQSSSSQPTPSTQTPTPAHPLVKSTSDSNAPISRSPELTELPGLGQPPAEQRQPHYNNQYQRSSWNNNNRYAPMAAPSVWGPPANDPSIASGIFNGDTARMPSAQVPSGQQAQPPPNSMIPAGLPASHLTPSPPGLTSQASDENTLSMQQPFQRRPGFAPQGYRHAGPSQARPSAATGLDAWNQFKDNVSSHDAQMEEERRQKADEEYKRLHAAKTASGNVQLGQQFRDKFIKTSVNDDDLAPGAPGKRRVVTTNESTFGGVGPRGGAASGHTSHLGGAASQAPLQAMPNGRSSRFFGPAVSAAQPSPVFRPIDQLPSSARSASPPPPETGAHPAFDQAVATPKVSLPKNKPTVKLPPLSKTPALISTANVIMPTNKPGSSNTPVDWHQRIHALFTRPAHTQPQTVVSQPPVANSIPIAPAQTPAAPIDSSSKSALVGSPSAASATVSMPVQPVMSFKNRMTPAKLDLAAQTKPASDGLVDNRQHGSQPPLKIPKGTHPRSDRILTPLPHLNFKLVKEANMRVWATNKPSELNTVFDVRANRAVINLFNGPRKVTYMSNKSKSNARSKNNRNNKRNASGKGPANAGDTNASADAKPMVNGVSASNDNASSSTSTKAKTPTSPKPAKAPSSNGEPSCAPAKQSRWPKKSDVKASRGPRATPHGPRAVTAQH